MRRAARWDGAVPLFRDAGHGQIPPLDQVRDLIAYIKKHRMGQTESPFEIALGGAGPPDPADPRDAIAALADAGATWSDERQLQKQRRPAPADPGTAAHRQGGRLPSRTSRLAEA